MPLNLEDGEPEETKKRGPGRPRKSETVGDLEKDMREQLDELANWISARDPELAQTFLDDVPRMALFLATRAGKHEALARLLRVLFAKDGPLAGLRAFGRTTRAVLARVSARRQSDDPEEGVWVDEHGNRRDASGAIVLPHPHV